MAGVGAGVGGVTLGLAMFFVYFIGLYLGIPFGLIVGGWLGWRTPLRDAIILFVTCYGGLDIGFKLATGLPKNPTNWPLNDLWQVALPILTPLAAVCLIYFGARQLLSFENRRTLAVGLATVAGLYLLWSLWQYAYVWQP